MEWGVEVVTLEWILECAKSQCILDAGLFPVPLFLGLCICTTGLYEGCCVESDVLFLKWSRAN